MSEAWFTCFGKVLFRFLTSDFRLLFQAAKVRGENVNGKKKNIIFSGKSRVWKLCVFIHFSQTSPSSAFLSACNCAEKVIQTLLSVTCRHEKIAFAPGYYSRFFSCKEQSTDATEVKPEIPASQSQILIPSFFSIARLWKHSFPAKIE